MHRRLAFLEQFFNEKNVAFIWAATQDAKEKWMKMQKRFCLCAMLFVVSPFALASSARAQSEPKSLFSSGYVIPQPRETVRLLERVPSGATLRQIKAILPRDTRFQWVPMTPMGDWKWNTLQFKGRFSGILVFANQRAKYRFKDAEKAQVAQWRAGDQVHSVDVFIGPAERDETPAQKTVVTKQYVETIARAVGRRGTRDFSDPQGGPPALGWSAFWKLSGARELRFFQDYSYSESESRPTLQLSFAYSHLYVS